MPFDIRIDRYVEPTSSGHSAIEQFKAKFNGGLRPNKYKVEFGGRINIGNTEVWEKMSMLCKGSVYSFYTYDKVEVFHNNTTQEYVNRINFEPIILRWYVDKQSDILKTLWQWKELQYSDASGMFGYRDDYMEDITVSLLDGDLEVVDTIVYHNAFPIAVDDIELGYEAVDTLMEVNVTFAYDYPTYTF